MNKGSAIFTTRTEKQPRIAVQMGIVGMLSTGHLVLLAERIGMVKINPLIKNGNEHIIARGFCFSPAYLHPGDSRSSTSGKVGYPSARDRVLGIRVKRSLS